MYSALSSLNFAYIHICHVGRGPGIDEISSDISKASAYSITGVVAHILLIPYKLLFFPDKLKIAKVIPIFKADDPCQLKKNYRPLISVLPALSKLLESLMHNINFKFSF